MKFIGRKICTTSCASGKVGAADKLKNGRAAAGAPLECVSVVWRIGPPEPRRIAVLEDYVLLYGARTCTVIRSEHVAGYTYHSTPAAARIRPTTERNGFVVEYQDGTRAVGRADPEVTVRPTEEDWPTPHLKGHPTLVASVPPSQSCVRVRWSDGGGAVQRLTDLDGRVVDIAADRGTLYVLTTLQMRTYRVAAATSGP